MEQDLDDTMIYQGVECQYSLQDDQGSYVRTEPPQFYGVTKRHAYDLLIEALTTQKLNPEHRAYGEITINEVEIPADIQPYLVEHPEVTLNPVSSVTQAVLRLRDVDITRIERVAEQGTREKVRAVASIIREKKIEA